MVVALRVHTTVAVVQPAICYV